MRVLCVTPNVSIDRTLIVPGFAAGRVWRAAEARARCGGKGINVARAVRALGGEATCCGLVGGHSGRLAAERLAAEGLAARWTWIEAESRTCIIVVGEGGEATVINEAGSPVSAADWARLVADVAGAAAGTDAVCICGSLPPGPPAGVLTRLIEAAGERPVWVDTSGAWLVEAVRAAPSGIKINLDEAAALIGRPLASGTEAAQAAAELCRQGVGMLAITLGSAGAVLADVAEKWRAMPPPIAARSPVGSGDAFLAALVLAVCEGEDRGQALARAVAAGSANALGTSAGDIDPEAFSRLLDEVRSERLRAG